VGYAHLHAVINAFHVYTEHLVEISLACGFQVADVRDPSIVYKNMDPGFLKDLLKRRIYILLLGNVARIGLGIPS
jgi:hypothetical protein